MDLDVGDDDYDRHLEEHMQYMARQRKEREDAAHEEMAEEHFRREAERERLEKEYDEGLAQREHTEDSPEDDD
jgi:hypothetical protein